MSLEHSNVDELYNESIEKRVFTPVEINALVLYNPPEEYTNNFSIDMIYSIEIYIHEHELFERNIEPREGDFVKFGEVIYEIKKVTMPQMTFGQVGEMVMKKLECIVSRESNFTIKEP